MQRTFLFFLFSIWTSVGYTQSSYFQQEVNYNLKVILNDQSHVLRGFETINYTNHSKDTLRFIYFHLWPNAYKSDQSAYVEQAVQDGQTNYYFSKEDDRGFIDSIDFKVNNESVNTSNYNGHEDVIILELNKPLLPEETFEITTPFRVVLPQNFSRLGHVGQSYQISQWFPKPAVYDQFGWHPMPYLDQGEFYSEFGNFEVKITLPSDYIVVASGDLQEESEKKFIHSLRDQTTKHNSSYVNNSGQGNKTITYKQQKVHDFAWFADKNLSLEFSTCTLASGKIIDCYSYYKAENKSLYEGSSKMIAMALNYFSEQLGEYPYQQMSLIDGPLNVGGGMEYPNVTIIGPVSSKSQLQTTIIHEVGHNWFYGMLGSNERDHPWMDESITSFYEQQLDDSLKKEAKHLSKADKISQRLDGIWLYQLNARQRLDQAIELPSTVFTPFNYGAILYAKGPQMLTYLKAYIGDVAFQQAMKQYVETWKFKHPYPKDFEKLIRASTIKNLDWFFIDGLKSNKKIDYSIVKVERDKVNQSANVFVNSTTDFNGPVSVSACSGDSILQTQWVEYPYQQSATFTSLGPTVDRFTIDAKLQIPEIKISNNEYKLNSMLHKFQPAIRLGSSFGISQKYKCFLLPALGYNHYDQMMLGAVVHNLEIPNNRFQFALVPLFSTASKKPVGSGFVSYTLYPKKKIHNICFGMEGRTYHFDESKLNLPKPLFLRYAKVMPFIRIELNKPFARSPIDRNFLLQTAFIQQQSFTYKLSTTDSLFRPSIENNQTNFFYRASYTHEHARTFNPFGYEFSAEGGANFMKLSVVGNLKIDYFKKNKAFHLRFFAGKFFDFKNSDDLFELRNKYITSTYTATNDYMYNHVFLARSEQTGILTNQISMREGGFKIQTNMLSNPIGQTNNWLSAINLRSDIPIGLPIKLQVFVDAATFANAGKENASGNKMIYDGGLELHLLNDLFIIYAPLMMSKDFKDFTLSRYPKNRLLNMMSFSLNLEKIQWFRSQSYIAKLLKLN